MASCRTTVQGMGQGTHLYVDQTSQDHIDKACSDLGKGVPMSRVAATSAHQSREGSPRSTTDEDSMMLFMTGEKADPDSRKAEKWLRQQDPVWCNHAGKVVAFDDLDFDLQVGLLTYRTHPIDDVEAYIRDMPKGKWSDYSPPEYVEMRGVKRKCADSTQEGGELDRLQEWCGGVEQGEDWKERTWTGQGLLVSRSAKIARYDGTEDVAIAEGRGEGEAAKEAPASILPNHQVLASLHEENATVATIAGTRDGGEAVERAPGPVSISHEIIGIVEKGNRLAAWRMMPDIDGQVHPSMSGRNRCQLRCSEACKPGASIPGGQAGISCLPTHTRL